MSATPPDDPNLPPGDAAGGGNESDRTIVRPRPGARIGAQAPAMAPPPAAAAPAPAASADAGTDALDAGALRVGDNAIVAAARPLLAIVAQIRTLARHPDPAALKEQLTAGVRAFEAELGTRGMAREKTIA
ncbi:MAG: DotU family type IV/VI secretion system protein, partial [Burkholderiales bacterium]